MIYLMRIAYHAIKPFSKETDYGFNIWQFIEVDLIDRGLNFLGRP